MLKLYHGTCSLFADSIRKDGLLPNAHKFEMRNTNGIALDVDPVVYVTTRRELAEEFARFRATYEQTDPGNLIHANLTSLPNIKQSGEAHPEAKPAVVTINLPEDWKEYLIPDGDWDELSQLFGVPAYECTKPIPSEYITRISTLRSKHNA